MAKKPSMKAYEKSRADKAKDKRYSFLKEGSKREEAMDRRAVAKKAKKKK